MFFVGRKRHFKGLRAASGAAHKAPQHMCLRHTLEQGKTCGPVRRTQANTGSLRARAARSVIAHEKKSSFTNTTIFAGLVAFARGLHPIPFRTRPLNPSAPMVLWLKPRESRSPPGLPSTRSPFSLHHPNIPRPKSLPQPAHTRPQSRVSCGLSPFLRHPTVSDQPRPFRREADARA